MTNMHMSPRSYIVLAAAALAIAGFGAACADTAAKFKPTAANLKHFVLAQGDLPEGYKRDNLMVSRSPGGCGDLGGNAAATRSYKRTLRALGFRRCASASFSKENQTQSDQELPMELTGEYGSEAILMRDRQAAANALPVVRRTLLKTLVGGDIETHSIPAPGLGSEAPRGILLTYDLERFGKVSTSIYVWRRGPLVAWVIAGHPPDDPTEPARSSSHATSMPASRADPTSYGRLIR